MSAAQNEQRQTLFVCRSQRVATSSAVGEARRNIVMTASVCLLVCLSVSPRAYLRKYTSDLQQNFFMHVTYGHRLVLCRRCDMLCISGFVDDVIFVTTLLTNVTIRYNKLVAVKLR